MGKKKKIEKTRTALLLRTDGSTKEIRPKNGTDFALEEVWELLGGYYEAIGIKGGKMMLVDEDGKSKRLPRNLAATAIFRDEIRNREVSPILEPFRQETLKDFILGSVILCDRDMLK